MSNPTLDDIAGAVQEAMSRAFNLGQTYGQQADSESYSQNRKSEVTHAKFREVQANVVDRVRALGGAVTPKAGPTK